VTITVLAIGLASVHAETVPLKDESGTFVVPVVVNNQLTLNFTIDSGAADVSIPQDVVSTLVRTGTISKNDIIGTRQYQLADGSLTTSRRIRIRSLRVWTTEVRNVVASIAAPDGLLLLGQSFLSQLPSWTIDNKAHLLVMNNGPAMTTNETVSPEAIKATAERADSDWLSLGSYSDSTGQMFIDTSSVRFADGHKLVWLKVMYSTHAQRGPGGDTDKWLRRVVVRDEIDCNGPAVRTDDMIFYYEDGSEVRAPADELPTHWSQDSNPVSAGAKEMKIVCGASAPLMDHN
jgi:hypothetical protein